MPKYKLEATAFTSVEIEAKTENEAKELAYKIFEKGDLEITLDDDGFEITDKDDS